MFLYHYFDKRTGPFNSLTALPFDKAVSVLEENKSKYPDSFCAKRDATYISKRVRCEALVKEGFAKKGGNIKIPSPHYMVLGHSPWLSTWYEQGDYIKIPIEEFDLSTLSFTYGDSMPTFSDRVNDGKEYRKTVYTYEEILEIIKKYGLPQDWNDDGKYGPERYIEVHVWSDNPISKYRQM